MKRYRDSIPEEENEDKLNCPNSMNMKSKKKKKKKNMMRLGGGGLSLEVFANAKSRSSHYNPAIIKKQREFYKNAKYVSKFKREIKQQQQQTQHNELPSALEDKNEIGEHSNVGEKKNKKKKNGSHSLRELYEMQHQEKEKERIEREAIIQAKNEEKKKAKARRKAERENMLKKNRRGQPVMKYRIEHLLQAIQGSK